MVRQVDMYNLRYEMLIEYLVFTCQRTSRRWTGHCYTSQLPSYKYVGAKHLCSLIDVVKLKPNSP